MEDTPPKAFGLIGPSRNVDLKVDGEEEVQRAYRHFYIFLWRGMYDKHDQDGRWMARNMERYIVTYPQT